MPEGLTAPVVDVAASSSLSAALAVRTVRRGLLLMVAATACFVAMNICVKTLREAGLGTAEVIFFRTAPGLLWLWWDLRVRRREPLRPVRRDLVYLRSVLGIAAMATSFYAVQALALVQHSVLHLLQPVFVALLAPLLLAEPLRRSAFAALVLAAAGSVLVIAPDGAFGTVPLLPAAVAVASAFASALAHMVIRRSMATERAEVIVFHFALHASLCALLWVVVAGDPRHLVAALAAPTWLPTVGLALLGLVGQILMTRAYGHAPAALVAIVGYVGIPMNFAGDVLLWRAHVAPAAVLGAALMVLAGVFLVPRRQPGQP
jgi:drug/metabolite transporter (DMT)-like permease